MLHPSYHQDGDHKICRQRNVAKDQHDVRQHVGHKLKESMPRARVENLDRKHHREAPDDRELQADIPVEVKGLFAIIPPSHVEDGIEQRSSHKLDHRTKKHSAKEYVHKRILILLIHQPHLRFELD